MLYLGVDHHMKTSHLTVTDESGQILKRKGIATRQDELLKALEEFEGEPIKAVLEASYSWGKMFDWLGEVADDVILAHPQKVRAIADARIKTDAIDSETLAHLLRADLIPEAYACSAERRAVNRVLRQRMFLVRVQTMFKNRIHATVNQHDLSRPKVSDLFGAQGMSWLSSIDLPYPDNLILSEDLRFLSEVRARISATEGLIRDLSRGDQAVKLLKSIPGIGDFFSVLIRYEVGDITRFRSPDKFASYTGLIPSTYSSGEKTFRGKLTKRGNKYLRWAFIEAVRPAVMTSPELRAYHDRIRRRKSAGDARVATARKLACITWYVWTEQRLYEIR